MTKRMIAIVMGIVTLAVSPAAAAAAGTESRSVFTTGLDLSNPDDLATVQERIKRAAWSICRAHDMFVSLSTELEANRCVKEAIASAQPQLDRAVATAFARRRVSDSVALASRR